MKVPLGPLPQETLGTDFPSLDPTASKCVIMPQLPTRSLSHERDVRSGEFMAELGYNQAPCKTKSTVNILTRQHC